jgi:hypothetical protein
MSLPKNCLYTNKINSSYSRNYQAVIQPQNGPANLGDTIIFNIPTGGNLVMSGHDTVLKFGLSIKNGATAAADGTVKLNKGGAYGVFQRMRVFAGGVLISDIDNYGNLMDMLVTCQQSTDTVSGKFKILAGTDNSVGASLGALAQDADPAPYYYCLPLMSIFSLSNNYVPLFALGGTPLRVELQLVSSITQVARSLTAILPPTVRELLTNIELVCNMMELSDSGMSIIKNAIGSGPLQWVTQDYRNYSQNIIVTNSDTTVSIPIPAKFNSLNSLFFSFRGNAGGALTRMANESNKFHLQEYFFRIGSKTLPLKPPNSVPEFLSELMRAFGSVSDVNHETNISFEAYNKNVSAAITSAVLPATEIYVGSFYVGIDLESYSNVPHDTIYSGMNTSSDDIFFVPRFSNSNAANTSVRVDSYALYDQLILINNGQVSVNY